MDGGPRHFGGTKELGIKKQATERAGVAKVAKYLGDKRTGGTKKQKKNRGTKKKIWGYQRAGGRWLNLSKFTKQTQICGLGTKIDFKDRDWYNYIRSL